MLYFIIDYLQFYAFIYYRLFTIFCFNKLHFRHSILFFFILNSLLTSFLLIHIWWNFVSYDGSFYLCFTLLLFVSIPFSYCLYMSPSLPFFSFYYSLSLSLLFSTFISLPSFFSFNYSLSFSLLFSTSFSLFLFFIPLFSISFSSFLYLSDLLSRMSLISQELDSEKNTLCDQSDKNEKRIETLVKQNVLLQVR